MRAGSEQKLRKIKKVSIVLRLICKALLAFIALLGLAGTVFVTFGIGGIDFDGAVFRTEGLSLGHRLLLGAITLVAWGVLFKGFYHLHRLFGNYSRGEIFTRNSVGQLRWFGTACVLWSVLSFVWLMSLAISTLAARTFRAYAKADELVIGAAIIVIAWFMDMAVDLREENDLTI